jgi:signal transduction histidine kinase
MLAFNSLKEQLPPNNRMARALERGLQRTNALVEQTLSVARVASGIQLRREPTTLAALFEDAELSALADAASKNIEIKLTIDGDERVDLDTRLVRSALTNLLRNGVKYSKPGCVVEVRGSIGNGCVAIEVEDCCGGLDPGKVEEAFAPFVRLDASESGFGLGLAIAKQATDAHGGSIRVQNLPGKGCIFVLELPLATRA